MSRYYTSEKRQIPSAGRDICLYIFRPTRNRKPRGQTPGILWIHGGGYVTGMAKMIYISRAISLVKKYGAVAVTPEYRLAGESAGGGLTAAVCMYARDRGEISIAFQMPLYPMLDDRDTDSSRDNRAPVWNTKRNHRGWKAYLGELYGKEVPPYAAPARQTDYTNLPPAYTFVGDIEPFYCETLAYVEHLRRAGVPAKADVYPRCFHAFDMLLPCIIE